MKILAIESSCDETAAAVVEDGVSILSSVIASSSLIHKKYGGIVPEIAAREQIKSIIPILTETLNGFDAQKRISFLEKLKSVDAIAITVGPGLIGSLLIGVETAKTLSVLTGKPLIPVNHVLAHMYANFLNVEGTTSPSSHPEFPAISLVVSGGHTELFRMDSPSMLTWLGGTLDDAAGEAFDKSARLLGFENRGGPAIQEAAAKANSSTIHLPRPLMHDNTLNFSFSGLKTAILREWRKEVTPSPLRTNEFAYEVQEAICEVLVHKTLKAVSHHRAKSILISGGVAANLCLRKKFSESLKNHPGVSLRIPPIFLCTDNAAYIGSYAFFMGQAIPWTDVAAQPDLSVETTPPINTDLKIATTV